MKRRASAVWIGGLKEGRGIISTESRILADTAYSYCTRFEDATGTNPEELIGAAHAACFAMALAAQLGAAGFEPEKIQAGATVTLEKGDDGFEITTVQLEVEAVVPKIDDERFQEVALKAKEGCPVSKLLNARITMDAALAKQEETP
jgi:osmotically inducible protein OsmC